MSLHTGNCKFLSVFDELRRTSSSSIGIVVVSRAKLDSFLFLGGGGKKESGQIGCFVCTADLRSVRIFRMPYTGSLCLVF